MMINSKILYFLIAMAVAASTVAQPIVDFSKSVHEFGDIVEGIKADHTFEFINTGDQPLIISNVRASCGCTTPYWTKEPVLPGKKGSITASYNSRNRPGAFNKSITITSNAKESILRVYIKGNVLRESDVKIYSEQELADSPLLTINPKSVNIGKGELMQKIRFELTATNTGNRALSFSGLKSQCNCISFEPGTARNIPSGQERIIKFIYTPRSEGTFEQEVRVFSNDIRNKNIGFKLKAVIVNKLAKENMLQESNQSIKF